MAVPRSSIQHYIYNMQFNSRRVVTVLLSLFLLATSTATTSESTYSTTPNPLSCPNFSPGPEPLYNLATDFPTPIAVDPVTIEAIRQTLALYPFAIDGKNWASLARIFTTDARANYSDPLGVLNGTDQIISVLTQSLSMFVSTQHLYGTQYIEVCSGSSAVSVTYYRAAHFFAPIVSGTTAVNTTEVLWAYGQYQDSWARQPDGTWKISNRNLVYMVSPEMSRCDRTLAQALCSRDRW